MTFQDISIGGNWFYRCRDKGTRMLNNLVKVTSLWKIWKRIYWILSLYLNLPPKRWESLEMSVPYKLQVCFDTIPVLHNWWSNTRIPFQFTIFCGRDRKWDPEESERDAQIFPLMVVWHSKENMEEETQLHWSPVFPHTVLRNHFSVLMVFSRDCEYPYWGGLQPRVRTSSFVTVCAFQKPTHPIPWNAKMMNLYFHIILTAEIIKHKHGTNLLSKLKITTICNDFRCVQRVQWKWYPEEVGSEEEMPSRTQSANWTLKKPLWKLLLVLQVGKFGLPQSPFKFTTTQWKN